MKKRRSAPDSQDSYITATYDTAMRYITDHADRDEADLAKQFNALKTGQANAFVYLNAGFDWEPLFRFSHSCNVFVFIDPRFTEERFNTAFDQIRRRKTKAKRGLENLQVGDPAYTTILERKVFLVEGVAHLDWLWEGTPRIKPWVTAKLLRRNIGKCRRKLWLVYIAASPVVTYEQLFVYPKIAPRCLCVRHLEDIDTPTEAEGTYPQRATAWQNTISWRGPLARMIRRKKVLPEFLVGDGLQLGWPHREVRQVVNNCQLEFGTVIYQKPDAQWSVPQPRQQRMARRVVATLRPLNPISAMDVDAIVLAPTHYRRYQWPEHLTIILTRRPRCASEAIRRNDKVVVRQIKGKSLAEGLAIVEQVAKERNLSRVAMYRFGYEDEGAYFSEWRQTEGAVKQLTVHAVHDGTYLDIAPFVDKCD